ncbi:stage III sporulation protein AA [Gorillibacterium sp. sgz5001074]|uniref:stage III sporulation protein AA n=1 Tax=Gorillibacterium sp. sgz5001074 TaxID=3446695 RepID=UPI003F679EB0
MIENRTTPTSQPQENAGTIYPLLPPAVREAVRRMPAAVLEGMEELRIREGRPLEVVYGGRYGFIRSDGRTDRPPEEAYRPTRQDCGLLLELLTRHSLYSFEEELRRGFITVEGGHRVGLAGRTVLEDGRVKQIRDVSGFNLRIARELRGCGLRVLPDLLDPAERTVRHTLIISPPGYGKTTLLRDLIRMISTGEWPVPEYGGGRKVGVVDERSELAASVRGVPRFDLGPRTDVMDGCPKAEGMLMMIRSMSPEVLAVDEIGRPEDAAAVHEAVHAGIRVLATAHGSNREDALRRPALRELAAEGVFSRYVVLRKGTAGLQVSTFKEA